MQGTRWLAVVSLVTASGCTVLEPLDGYSGGTSADSGSADTTVEDAAPVDTATADTATEDATALDSASPDTGRSDTGTSDTGSPDTGSPDTGSPDTGVDSTIVDTGVADGSTADSDATIVDTGIDTSVADTAADVPFDDAGCAYANLGLSELMVRAVSGSGDTHEWIELTNYGTCTLDIGGATVRVVSAGFERAAFTFPPGTTVAASEAIVVAANKTAFKADVASTYVLGQVFDFGKTSDVLVNGGNFYVTVTAPGASLPFENALVPSRGSTWPTLSRSYGYPVPSSTCPASGRLTPTGTLSSTWKDQPGTAGNEYGATPGATPVVLYGSPTKPNTAIACP